jgi:DNA-binding MarR family transcriptional regulator
MYGIQTNSKASPHARLRRQDVHRVVDAVRHLVRALRLSHQEAERSVGLSAAQLFVLQSLRDSEPASLNDVAARTATDQSSVSVVVSRLVSQGLVLRRRSAEDARRLELRLSSRAHALLRRAPRFVAPHALVAAVEELSLTERRTLGRLLARVVDAMGGEAGAAGMFFEEPPRDHRSGTGTANGS